MSPRYLLLLLLTIHFSAFCQEYEKPNQIGIKMGYAGLRIRDKVISTLAYSGNAIPLEICYNHQTHNFKFNTSFTLNASDTIHATSPSLDGFSYKGDYGTSIDSSISSLDHKTLKSNFYAFDLELLAKVADWKEEKLVLFVGASYNTLRIDKKYLLLSYTNNSNSRFNSLSMIATLDYHITGKHKLSYTAWLPILTRSTRTLVLEYGNPPTNIIKYWSSVNNFLSLNNKIVYNFHFARKWSLEAQYRLTYYKFRFPRTDQAVLQMLTGGINFHF